MEDEIKARLVIAVQKLLVRPLFVKEVSLNDVILGEKHDVPRFCVLIAKYDAAENIIPVMALIIPFDEVFHGKHRWFAAEKTLILISEKAKEYAQVAAKMGEGLKQLTGEEFDIRWTAFIEPMG